MALRTAMALRALSVLLLAAGAVGEAVELSLKNFDKLVFESGKVFLPLPSPHPPCLQSMHAGAMPAHLHHG